MVLLYMLTLSMVSLPTILARNHFVGNPKGGDYQLPPPLPPRDYEHTNHPGPFYINKEGRPVYSEKLVHPGPGFSKKLEHPGSDYSKKSQMPPPPMRVENVKCSKGVKRTSKEKGVIKVYCKKGNTVIEIVQVRKVSLHSFTLIRKPPPPPAPEVRLSVLMMEIQSLYGATVI